MNNVLINVLNVQNVQLVANSFGQILSLIHIQMCIRDRDRQIGTETETGRQTDKHTEIRGEQTDRHKTEQILQDRQNLQNRTIHSLSLIHIQMCIRDRHNGDCIDHFLIVPNKKDTKNYVFSLCYFIGLKVQFIYYT